jgi:hypothetical protein
MMAEKAPAYISAVRPPCKLDEKSEATLNEVEKNVADAMKLIPDVKDIERAKSDAQAARAAKNKSENIDSVLIKADTTFKTYRDNNKAFDSVLEPSIKLKENDNLIFIERTKNLYYMIKDNATKAENASTSAAKSKTIADTSLKQANDAIAEARKTCALA